MAKGKNLSDTDEIGTDAKADSNPSPRKKRPFVWLIVLGLVAVGTYLIVARPWQQPTEEDSLPSKAEIPQPQLSGLSPNSVAVMNSALNAVKQSPEDGDAWGKLGMGFYAHEKIDEAILCFEQAEKLAKSNPKWPYLLGMVIAESDFSAGRPAIQRALDLDKDNVDILLRLVEFHIALDDHEQAEKLLVKVARSESTNPRVKLGLARIAFAKKNWSKARYHCEEALLLAPMRPDIVELMSRACFRDGDTASANRYAEQLEQLKGASAVWSDSVLSEVMTMRVDAETLLAQAARMESAGRVRESLETLDQVVRSYPENAEGFLQFGQALLRAQKFDICARVAADGVKLHPTNSELLFLKAISQLQLNQVDEAIETLGEVLKLKPDYTEASFVLGNVYLKLDKKEKALKAFREVLRYDPVMQPAIDAIKNLESK